MGILIWVSVIAWNGRLKNLDIHISFLLKQTFTRDYNMQKQNKSLPRLQLFILFGFWWGPCLFRVSDGWKTGGRKLFLWWLYLGTFISKKITHWGAGRVETHGFLPSVISWHRRPLIINQRVQKISVFADGTNWDSANFYLRIQHCQHQVRSHNHVCTSRVIPNTGEAIRLL